MCKPGVARLVKPLWRRNNTPPAVAHAGPHGLRFHAFCVCPPRPVSHRHHAAGAVLDLEAVHMHRQLQVREDPRDTAQVPEVLDLGLATAIFGAEKPCHKLLCNTSPTRRRRATLRDGQYLAWEFPQPSEEPYRTPSKSAGASIMSFLPWPTYPCLDVSGSDSSHHWYASRHRRGSLPRGPPSSRP